MKGKATKKPVTIDFYSIENTIENGEGFYDWIKSFGDTPEKLIQMDEDNRVNYIITLEGAHEFSSKDVIIRGIKGEYYPCKKDIFELTYNINN